MLRRYPTAIKLTTNDLALYDDFKRSQDTSSTNPNNTTTNRLPPSSAIDPRSRQRTREERIGLGNTGTAGYTGSRQ